MRERAGATRDIGVETADVGSAGASGEGGVPPDASFREARLWEEDGTIVEVTVSHGSLEEADYALMVATFQDETLSGAERFLDESLLNDQRTVRFIHGYGTGQLKRALSGFLQQHPLVARFAAAAPEQGGGGVTVVELKD